MQEPQAEGVRDTPPKRIVRRLDQPLDDDGHDGRRQAKKNHTPIEPDTGTPVREKGKGVSEAREKEKNPSPAEKKTDGKIPRVMEFLQQKYNLKWDDLKAETQQKLILLAEAKDLSSFEQLIMGSIESIHDYINPDNPLQLKDYLAFLNGLNQKKIPTLELFKGLSGYSGDPIADIPELKDVVKAEASVVQKEKKQGDDILSKIINGIDNFLESILRFLGLSSNNPPKTATGTA